MKYSLYYSILICTVFSLTLSSCVQDECDATRSYTVYKPIYLTSQELRAPIELTEPRSLENPGKIYYYKNYLLINEFEEGIHFFDNSNPANPVSIAFLPIKGNVDMAIRDDRLYADSYVDLVTFNISDPINPILVSRTEDIFNKYGLDAERGYIIRYEATTETQEIGCEENWQDVIWFEELVFVANDSGVRFDASTSSSTPKGSTTGVGGSLARFTIAKDYLYTVSEFDLKVFDLENPDEPNFLNTSYIGWAMETIFPYGDIIFIGARNGMHIVDIKNPQEPVYRSSFWHTTACDPVYVDKDVAYVTLRSGTECDGFSNQLDVLNVEDLDNPFLIRSYEMHHPIGLSVYNDHLYLCEDDQGLKVFDASEPALVGERLLNHDDDFTAVDIITLASEKIALVIGGDGLYQFDISSPSEPRFLSRIDVNK